MNLGNEEQFLLPQEISEHRATIEDIIMKIYSDSGEKTQKEMIGQMTRLAELGIFLRNPIDENPSLEKINNSALEKTGMPKIIKAAEKNRIYREGLPIFADSFFTTALDHISPETIKINGEQTKGKKTEEIKEEIKTLFSKIKEELDKKLKLKKSERENNKNNIKPTYKISDFSRCKIIEIQENKFEVTVYLKKALIEIKGENTSPNQIDIKEIKIEGVI